MSSLYPRPDYPPALAAIHLMAVRAPLAGTAAAHASNGLLLIGVILTIVVLLTAGWTYHQIAPYLKMAVAIGMSLLLLFLGGATLALILALVLLRG